MAHVAGYTVAHDVSARDWQLKKNGGQWLLGKTFDTYCPLGPVIVTTAALSGIIYNGDLVNVSWMSFDFANIDPHNLGIRCRLNGETVQDSNTNQLVHKTQELVAWISQCVVFTVSVHNNILSTYKIWATTTSAYAYVSCLISILQG